MPSQAAAWCNLAVCAQLGRGQSPPTCSGFSTRTHCPCVPWPHSAQWHILQLPAAPPECLYLALPHLAIVPRPHSVQRHDLWLPATPPQDLRLAPPSQHLLLLPDMPCFGAVRPSAAAAHF
ncbi:hypothetical protein NDU88_002243 [Pleurodeles waltl]|uniref:Uncharacterized protein n=1 Tax=Pleurodeles waltl TaxID=8319 RepID=A0AAV7T2Q1_PLEWA|nr:hypothetical protein NDU88_002243 [Pleurodeles waltl]